jgi:anti-sigma factor RsiW
MTDYRPAVRDIDLMAYADGLLDADPKRKAEVEIYLRQHPEEGARVRDYAAQNNAIRRLYSPVLREPVPERLQAVLDSRRRRWALGPVARAAIAAGLMLVAGFTGWVIGQRGQSEPWPMHAFVKQMLMTDERPYLISSSDSNRALNQAMEERTQPLDWLSDQIAVSLQVPDLTSKGFTLVEKRLVAANGPQAVQVIYATPSGRRLSLFLRTRWQDEMPQFRFAENDGVTMVYWLEGPLAYALAGQLDQQEMMDVVQTLRTSMRHQPQDTMSQIAPETVSPDTLQAPQVTPTQPVPLNIPQRSKYP